VEVFHDTATQCHLPYGITCYPTQVNTPRLNRSHAGWYSTYLPRRDGRLSWPSWLDSAPAGSRTSDLSIRSRTLYYKILNLFTELQESAFCSPLPKKRNLGEKFAKNSGRGPHPWSLELKLGPLGGMLWHRIVYKNWVNLYPNKRAACIPS